MSHEITVAITLGDENHLGIDKHNNLICFSTKQGITTDYINLGRFTEGRYKELKEYLDRLSIHTVSPR